MYCHLVSDLNMRLQSFAHVFANLKILTQRFALNDKRRSWGGGKGQKVPQIFLTVHQIALLLIGRLPLLSNLTKEMKCTKFGTFWLVILLVLHAQSTDQGNGGFLNGMLHHVNGCALPFKEQEFFSFSCP